MPPSIPDSELNQQIYQQATEWLIAFRTSPPDAVSRERLDAWLRKSPEHVRAYLEVSAIWEEIGLHDPQLTITAEAHIARALDEDNLVRLNLSEAHPAACPASAQPTTVARTRSRPVVFGVAASLLAVVVAAGVMLYVATETYATARGEVRSISLADGSIVDLNADSRVRVRFSKSERDVDLIKGEVLFQVEHDPNRPFFVRSGTATVRDVGTEFDVFRGHSSTTVTVIEGQVAVTASQANHRLVSPRADAARLLTMPDTSTIAAGEQVTVLPAMIEQPIRVNTAAAVSWVQRRLIFDSAPLSEVVRQFNRYNARPIIIDDRKLDDLRVIGVFSSTDPSSLLRFLSGQPGVQVIETERAVRITGHQIPESLP